MVALSKRKPQTLYEQGLGFSFKGQLLDRSFRVVLLLLILRLLGARPE